ncbi:MAG TPA: hypothetical protein DDW49_11405 [Deltaproteobacteria bacterium]|nr:MAG: hypothetical protein A2048_05615 [Deltaproteobacteria bacterium GWA2_45_12]HBF13973.1 hypothetical protein [Deltaproteobacteria bacterium]
MENKFVLLIALAAGVAVGMNWGKIKKGVGPYAKVLEAKTVDGYNGIIRFFAEQKEHLEDVMAASKVHKSRPVSVVKNVKRSGGRKGKVGLQVAHAS